MNGETLYTLTTNLLGGNALDEDLFYQLLNLAKNQREMMRDWMKLRTYDTSITFTASDTYLTGKSLPERFLRTYSFDPDNSGVFIVTAEGAKMPLSPISMSQRYDYRNMEGYYYIDHANSTISRTGAIAGTLHLNYLRGTVDITENTEWSMLPDSFTSAAALLAYDVAMEQKGGIDWDRVNASQIPYNQRKLQSLETNLATWDARLQQAEIGV